MDKEQNSNPQQIRRVESQPSLRDAVVAFTYDEATREVIGVVEVVLGVDENGRKIGVGAYGARAVKEDGEDMLDVRKRIRERLAVIVSQAILGGNEEDQGRPN